MTQPPRQPLANFHTIIRAEPGNINAPVGTVLYYAKDKAPPGFLLCHGQLLPRDSYRDLFACIGHLYSMEPVPENWLQKTWRKLRRRPAPMRRRCQQGEFFLPDFRGRVDEGGHRLRTTASIPGINKDPRS